MCQHLLTDVRRSGLSKNMGTHALIPACSLLISGCCAGIVTQLNLVKLSEILLVSGSTAEVAFAAVVGNGFIKTPCRRFWVVLSIGLWASLVTEGGKGLSSAY